ncbi:hypothetical protein [Streptomyces sp. NPDC005805]|uniref:hypothetical protein n=1 Tax=Streptomyces sp. NPDC005805 TaxID=3157068 RepID=UPI0033D93934
MPAGRGPDHRTAPGPTRSAEMDPGQDPRRDPLLPGTRQLAQLQARWQTIAWTALCLLLALWAVWSAVAAVRGTSAWAYSAVACLLLAVAVVLRVAAVRRRTRL